MKTPSTPPAKPAFRHELSDEEKSLPLGIGDAPAEDAVLDPLAGAGEARRLKTSSILIVVVVLIAGAGLWFMRSLSHVSGAVAGKNDIDTSIEKFLDQRDGKGNGKTGANVLAVLSSSYADRQVPLDSVQCNPFILPGEGQSKTNVPIITGDNSAAVMAEARTARQKDFANAAKRLVLKSIIMSSQPLANISGMIVREGDELSPENSDVTFTVERISADSVLLIASDIALGLKVEYPISMRRDL